MEMNTDLNVLGTLEGNNLGVSLKAQIVQIFGDSWDKRVPLLTRQITETEVRLLEKIDRLMTELAKLSEKHNEAIQQYNAAVEVVNNMSARLAALEANYDPTIIGG